MTATKILARDHGKQWEINTGTSQSPTWTRIKGLNSWSPSPSKNDADTTGFDDDGWTAHMVASRGGEFTLSGHYLEDPDTGDRDPGQEAVETLANAVGYDSLKEFRFTSPGGIQISFSASASVTSGGGGNDDPSAWEATLTVSGKLTKTKV